MISNIVVGEGSSQEMGRMQGEILCLKIKANISSFWERAEAWGYKKREVLNKALKEEGLLSPQILEEIEGMARGSRLEYGELLAYNLYHDLFSPEECTVLIALGTTTARGETILLKNSDKVGGESLVGPNFYKFKEINVILDLKVNQGNRIIGVAAAGSSGLKMGMNDKGIASGCNIARTEELKGKKADLTQMRALDRGQLMREGLEKNTIYEAGALVAGKVLRDPMNTPGNLEFADAREAVIIEGSYDRLNVLRVKDEVLARSNRLTLFEELNDKRDVSSICRYVRCMELLEKNKGKITAQMMKEFSMDHQNGPGPNSICRHGSHHSEEVSLSSAIMEIDGKNPQKSKISIALGKPCHAWREKEGQITLSLDSEPQDIPLSFSTGEVWKRFYQEEARES